MALPNPEIVKLLFGPYRMPKLHRGARVLCQLRDQDVIVTGYTNARISWPKGRLAENRGQPSLVVDDELARALHNESRAAVAYWWGLARSTITRWRIKLGVKRYNAGSKRLQLISSEKGARAVRGVPLSPEAVERRRRTALELGLRPSNGYGGFRPWTANELGMLGTMPDEVLSKKLDRSARAVRLKRTRLGMVKLAKRRWTAKDDALLVLPAAKVAELTGRTIRAIYTRRKLLNLKRRQHSVSKQSSKPETP